MKYQGSKRRIADEILPIILQNRKPDQYYVEPFVGGGNSICRVTGKRIGADINPYLIEFWKGLLEGKRGPFPVSKEMYDKARIAYHNKIVTFEIAWIGYIASFNGRFFSGGYAKLSDPNRNYHLNQIKNVEKQLPFMRDIAFYCCSYNDLQIPPESIIYCDPPYKGQKGYESTFNHERFYEWCRKKKSEGHFVYVSEFEMPEDFTCIWEKSIKMIIYPTRKLLKKEKLFVLN